MARVPSPATPIGTRRGMLTSCVVAAAASIVRSDEVIVTLDRRQADRVRAAYVYSFLRYVRWPVAFTDSLRIQIVGNPPLGELLRKIAAKKKFTDRKTDRKFPIVVEAVDRWTAPVGHLVYLSPAVSDVDVDALLRSHPDTPTLTIRDAITADGTPATPAAPAPDGVRPAVRFVVRDGGVKFDLELDEAERRGLRFNAKLLQAADQIRRGDA